MQPYRLSALRYVLSFILWGLLLGTLGGLILFFPYSLAYYGILGILFNSCIGGILGFLNGIVVAIIRRWMMSNSSTPNQRLKSILVSIFMLFVSLILYGLMLYPLTRKLDGSPQLEATFLCSIPPAIAATLVAAFVTRRIQAVDVK